MVLPNNKIGDKISMKKKINEVMKSSQNLKRKQLLVYIFTICNAFFWLIVAIEKTPKKFNSLIALCFISAFLLGGCMVWFNDVIQEAKKNKN